MMNATHSHGDIVAVNGIDLYFEIHGQGEPLLLLHGGSGAGTNWRLIFDLDAPPSGYQFIVPDLRGHGRSTNPSRTITFRQLALDILALLDHLEIERVKAIGLSMGAKTLLHLATLQPHRVTAMVLVSAAPHFPESTRAAIRAAAAAPQSEQDWKRMRQWHAHGDEQIRDILNMAFQIADNYDDMNFDAERLAGVEARTLIVHGERDALYPTSLALELHSSIRDSQLWIVPEGGHGPIFGALAPEFARRALAFLSEHPANGPT